MYKRISWMAGVLAAGLAQAATLTWSGAGDGRTFGDAANWTPAQAPVAGDALVFANGAALTVENDVADLRVASLTFSGAGATTVNGLPIEIRLSGVGLKNAGALTVNAPLAFTQPAACQFQPAADATFNGEIAIASGATFKVADTANGKNLKLSFNGGVTGLDGRFIVSQQGQYYFTKPFRVRKFECAEYKGKTLHLQCAGNLTREFPHFWYSALSVEHPDAFDPACVLGFAETSYKESNVHVSSWYFNGNSATACRIWSGKPAYNGNDTRWVNADHFWADMVSNGSRAMTLTLKGDADSRTWALLHGALSVVWDPVGDYTQTFLDRTQDTTGSLTVKRGAIRLDGTNSFANVPAITVAPNARFELFTTNTAALAGVTALKLGEGAKFLSQATAVTPFGATPKAGARICGTSRFVLPGATALQLASLIVDGVPVAAGTYTSETLPQVEGSGTLVVAGLPLGTYWTGAAGDGKWSTAENWSAGLPSASNPAYIRKAGTYAISIDGLTTAGNVTLDKEEGEATLDVASDWTMTQGVLDVGGHAKVAVGASGAFTYDGTGVASASSAPNVALHDGGALVVDGGVVNITNLTGRCSLYGGTGSEGRIEISSGDVSVRIKSGADGLAFQKGGLLKMTGGTFAFNHVPVQTGGAIDCSGTASVLIDYHAFTTMFKTITARFAGQSRLYWKTMKNAQNQTLYARFRWSPNGAGETNLFEVVDQASFDFSPADQTYIGSGTGTSILRLDTTGKVHFGNAAGIAFGNGVGIIEIKRGYTQYNSYSCPIGALENGTQPGETRVPLGILRMTGGGFYARTNRDAKDRYEGLILADAQYGRGSATWNPTGVVELAGGAITNNGLLIAGCGGGFGRVTQSGGAFVQLQPSRRAVIGFKGGTGLYEISGGTARFESEVFVGGAPTNRLDRYVATIADTHPGRGTLRVTGGVFEAKRPLSVSLDGAGAVEIGADGLLKATDLVLASSVDGRDAATTYPAQLTFRPGAATSGRIEASGTLTVATDARLTVDLADYASRKSLQLATYAAREGAFAPENVTILPETAARRFAVVQSDTGIRLCSSSGTCVIFR